MGATRLRGEILSYDSTTGTGLISGDDGARYDFTSAALQSPAVPAAGVRVDFVPEGSVATQILILAGGPTTLDRMTDLSDIDVLVVRADGECLATPGFRAA